MAWRGEQRGGQLQLPLAPAIARCGRVRERLDLPVSVRYRERDASRVARLPRSQGPESAGLAKVATCAAFALLPPRDSPHRRPRRNSEGVVVPLPTNILQRHGCSAYKVSLVDATTSCLRHQMR